MRHSRGSRVCQTPPATPLVTIEVTEDDATFDRYAHRVPVLIVGNAEHDWPFDAKAVSQTLHAD